MTCSQCTSRILRSFVTDLSIPSNATTSTRRSLNRLTPSRTSTRYASSSAPRNQSAEVSNPANGASTPDFLGMYVHAKKNPNKEALASWGNSWKTETDLTSIHTSRMQFSDPATGKKEDNSFTFLDDYSSTASQAQDIIEEEIPVQESKETISLIPASLKRHFPTRSAGAVKEDPTEIPWDDPEAISKKIQTPHDGEANAWKEWSTPELWSNARLREKFKSRNLPNGTRLTKRAAMTVATGELKWKPEISADYGLDRFKKEAGLPTASEKNNKENSKDLPEWQIHKEAVKRKIGNKGWNPFMRLSPAAVATLKQLKAENPGMTVEEYAPIFKISPDALRRILRSKWQPKPEEETDRLERWKRRGQSVWQEWEEKGLVETKQSRKRKLELKLAQEGEKKKVGNGFVIRKGLNLKNRIL